MTSSNVSKLCVCIEESMQTTLQSIIESLKVIDFYEYLYPYQAMLPTIYCVISGTKGYEFSILLQIQIQTSLRFVRWSQRRCLEDL